MIKETFHEKIVKALDEITEEKVLVVKCNIIEERSALFRLAYSRGFLSRPINYYHYVINFIRLDEDGYTAFGQLNWMYDYEGDCYYYHFYDDDDDVYVLEFKQDKDIWNDEKIVALDYNAIVIYPGHMKKLKDKDRQSFVVERQKRKTDWEGPKGRQIKDEQEIARVINCISFPDMDLVKISEVLI